MSFLFSFEPDFSQDFLAEMAGRETNADGFHRVKMKDGCVIYGSWKGWLTQNDYSKLGTKRHKPSYLFTPEQAWIAAQYDKGILVTPKRKKDV